MKISGNVPLVKKPAVMVGRLAVPQDWSDRIGHASCVRFLILILAPLTTKATKNSFEIARSVSTLFSSQEWFLRLFADTNLPIFYGSVKFWKRFASDLDDVITSDLFHSNFAKKTDELESSQRESDDIELEELPGVEDIPLYHVGRGLWGDIRYDFYASFWNIMNFKASSSNLRFRLCRWV